MAGQREVGPRQGQGQGRGSQEVGPRQGQEKEPGWRWRMGERQGQARQIGVGEERGGV